jgi:hypothetical protein
VSEAIARARPARKIQVAAGMHDHIVDEEFLGVKHVSTIVLLESAKQEIDLRHILQL